LVKVGKRRRRKKERKKEIVPAALRQAGRQA
jgi:hypothetical protein